MGVAGYGSSPRLGLACGGLDSRCGAVLFCQDRQCGSGGNGLCRHVALVRFDSVWSGLEGQRGSAWGGLDGRSGSTGAVVALDGLSPRSGLDRLGLSVRLGRGWWGKAREVGLVRIGRGRHGSSGRTGKAGTGAARAVGLAGQGRAWRCEVRLLGQVWAGPAWVGVSVGVDRPVTWYVMD
jgi:hypothetical protein